nr:isoform 2 of ankyrin-3 [Quercus suber]
MDPGGLLLRIAILASSLETITGANETVSYILSLVQSQATGLQTGLHQIQEWLHFSDTASKSQVLPSLQDAMDTVDATVQRLSDDVEVLLIELGTSGADLQDEDLLTESHRAHSEQRLRRHLTDLRECVRHTAEVGLEEVKLGAKTLHRAQTCARRERRDVIERSRSLRVNERSTEFESFLDSILAAEAYLADEPVPPVTPQSALHSYEVSNQWAVPAALSLKPKSQHPSAETELYAIEMPGSRVEMSHGDDTLTNSEQFSGLRTRVSREVSGPSSDAGDSLLSCSNSVITLELRDNLPTTAVGETAGHNLSSLEGPPGELMTESSGVLGSSVDEEPQTKFRNNPMNIGSPARPEVKSKSLSPQSLDKVPIHDPMTAPSYHVPPTYNVMDKILPLKQSLATLGTNEYLNVESVQSTVEPYADSPPSYVPQMQTPFITGGAMNMVQSTATPAERERGLHYDGTMASVLRLVRENRTRELRKVLTKGCNVNEVESTTGRTLIMEATRLRRLEACQILLQGRSRLHLKDVNGNTALHICAQGGDAEICQLLLEAGASGRECNSEGKTPLELAAGSGNSEAVLCLLHDSSAHRSSEVNDPALVKAFLEAVRTGDLTTAQIILSMDVQPHKLKEAWKPITYAAESGSIPMLDLIVGQDCNLKATNPDGWTALHIAASRGHLSMVEKLLTLKLSRKLQTKRLMETALHLSAAAGHTSTSLALIVHKSSSIIMIKDVDDQEPLHHAVRKGDTRLVSTLIEHGAKFKNETKYGWKPIHLAAAYGHTTLVADLMTRGVSVEEKLNSPSFKPEKRTNEAAKRGYWAEIRWPHTGARALHLACEFARDDVARMLISGGAKFDESDSAGWRPLHHAAFSARPDIVQFLLEQGAAPDAKTNDGFTPLSLGFREQVLSPADIQARNRVTDMLQVSMLGTKTSRFRQLKANLLPTTGTGKSKSATQRNQIWHTAQLAENLHQTDIMDEGEVNSQTDRGSSMFRQDTGLSELDSSPAAFEAPAH